MKRTLALCLLLTACAEQPKPEPVVVTKDVKIAVPVPCERDIGEDPNYPDTDAALRSAANLFERVKLLVAGRELRIDRDRVKTKALKSCQKITQ